MASNIFFNPGSRFEKAAMIPMFIGSGPSVKRFMNILHRYLKVLPGGQSESRKSGWGRVSDILY
jgi:hypothetical protein